MGQLVIFLFMTVACSGGLGFALAYFAKVLIETETTAAPPRNETSVGAANGKAAGAAAGR